MMVRKKVDRFWDLVRIVKERQKDVMMGNWEHRWGLKVVLPASIGTVEQTVEDREERIYCGVKFPSKKGKEQHANTCSETD